MDCKCNHVLPSVHSKPTFDSMNGIVRLVREEPPAHCIFKVESFSKVNKDHVDSSEFEAGGFTWVLSVYPKGHKQKGADGHLSVFVSMVDELSPASCVYVMLRFFIYDQLKEKFHTVLDVKDHVIYANMKSAPGIPKFLPLDTFTQASNGFLLNDCCVFGAEVLVVKGAHNIRACAFTPEFLVKDRPNKKHCASPWSYTWKIEHFSQLKTSYYSQVFRLGEWYWRLLIYPNGSGLGKGKYISVFLELENPVDIPVVSTLYAKFQLCLKNQGVLEDHKKTTSKKFTSVKTEDWGFASFLEISEVHNKGFLVNDALILELEMEEMSIQ